MSLRRSDGLITSGILLSLAIASAVWVALNVAAPFMAPPDTLLDLSGTIGMRENDDQFESLSVLPRVIYTIGDLECHQIPERSYFLNGNQMPFCARDLGLFAGLMVGFGVATVLIVQINPVLLLFGLVPMGLDGGVQLVTEYESANPLRLATGIVAGASLALLLAVFILALREDVSHRRRGAASVVPPETRAVEPQEDGEDGQA